MAESLSSPAAHALALVQSALNAVDDPAVPLSAVIRKAKRIARLRNDAEALLWLDLEMRPLGDEFARNRTLQEIAPHFGRDELSAVWRDTTEAYIRMRSISEGKVLGFSVPEAEVNIEAIEGQIARLTLPAGLHTLDAYYENQRQEEARTTLAVEVQDRRIILARVRQRVADYLSQTERQLLYGQVNSDIFERNREFVDAQLKALAPEALEQFAAAYRRRGEGDAEARSHALTSCRRVLKTVADKLYPAANKAAEGVDGVSRKMTDDKFISRLCQFAGERAAGRASGDLLVAQIKTLGERLDALNDLSSKGVHAGVSDQEVDQCVIQTYLAVGDLLRLATGDSGIVAAEAA